LVAVSAQHMVFILGCSTIASVLIMITSNSLPFNESLSRTHSIARASPLFATYKFFLNSSFSLLQRPQPALPAAQELTPVQQVIVEASTRGARGALLVKQSDGSSCLLVRAGWCINVQKVRNF
jgi:hypothetical protein